MSNATPQSPDSQIKYCVRCKQDKPVSEFYLRSGMTNSYLSECKECIRGRNKTVKPLPPTEPRAASESLAITALRKVGIPSIPGKAISYPDVDVVAFGCVRIEVKYAKLDHRHNVARYQFAFTPRQQQRGVLADIIMLICDAGDVPTFHLFPAGYPAFYIKGRLKTGFTFTPGATVALKHGGNRVVMIQSMMDEARNRWSLVWAALKAQSDALKQEAS